MKKISERKLSVHRGEVGILIEVDEKWDAVEVVEPIAGDEQGLRLLVPAGSLEGIVSPAFRKLGRAPFLKLTARPGDKPCVFTTAFLASAHA